MPTVNPHYNPDWKSIHDQHVARQGELEAQIDALTAGREYDDLDHDRIRELREGANKELKSRLNSFRMQHQTIQEYAQWVFSSFPTDMSSWGERVPTFLPDFESFTTIEQVSEAWSEYHTASKEAADMVRNKLPTGRPDDMDIFEHGPDRQISTHNRAFSHEDIYGYKGNLGAQTVITADIRPDGLHICLTDLWRKYRGLSVINTIENLATRLYYEIAANQQQSIALEYKNAAQAVPSSYRPDQLHFYIHMPPGEDFKEKFMAVPFRSFEDGRYKSPQWNHFEVIPKTIQDAWTKNPQINVAPPPALLP